MTTSISYVAEDEVHAALDYPRLVDALHDAFIAGATAPVRSSHAVTPEDDRLLLMPAWDGGGGLGVKIVTVFPRNRERGVSSVGATYLLLDGRTGHPRLLIDGEALTLRRTAAASALAARHLARQDARHLVVVGSGRLAPYMAAAHCAVRPIDRVTVWGRTYERAQALASGLASGGLAASAARDLEAALADADVVTCATTSREPVVRGAWIRPGTHIDLVGAFTAQMREVDDDLVAKSELYVDTFAGALKEGGDIVQAIAAGRIARDAVRAELADLCAGRVAGRTSRDSITLFKSVGTALEDLAAAQLVARLRSPA